MKRNVNKILLIGNVIKKPDLQETGKGVAVCTFHILTDRIWFTNGEKRKETTKHICVAWSNLATSCYEVLNGGDLVYLGGRMSNHKYFDAEGNELEESRMIVEEFELISSKHQNYGAEFNLEGEITDGH